MLDLFRRFLKWLSALISASPQVIPTSAPEATPKQQAAVARLRQEISQVELPSEAMPEGPPIYQLRRDGLFSYQERVFYRTLQEIVDPQYQIFAKVRMADLLWLSNEVQNRKYHNNQIQCKHLDFVICDKGGLKPALVIELDDSSHSRYDRRESDEFKDRVFQEVGLHLLRVPVQEAYSREDLKAQIEEKLGLKEEPADNAY